MNEHIDILLLLDYAQGKILDEEQLDTITDHLCECDYCLKILKSHFYLISNSEALLEKFFPEVEAVFSEETVNEIISQPEYQLSVGSVKDSVSDKIQKLKKRADDIGREIKSEILRFLDEIKSFSALEEKMIPLQVNTITFLGSTETGEINDKKLKYLSHNIILGFLPILDLKIEDFQYEFTGRLFYISYEKDNFKDLKGRKVNLTTDTGFPFIFTSTFEETDTGVVARFEIGFEDIPADGESTTKNENYYKFFLSID